MDSKASTNTKSKLTQLLEESDVFDQTSVDSDDTQSICNSEYLGESATDRITSKNGKTVLTTPQLPAMIGILYKKSPHFIG